MSSNLDFRNTVTWLCSCNLPTPGCTLLCTLIMNYGCWMFFLVSSAHAMWFQEAKHDRDETFGGEHRLTLRKFKSH